MRWWLNIRPNCWRRLGTKAEPGFTAHNRGTCIDAVRSNRDDATRKISTTGTTMKTSKLVLIAVALAALGLVGFALYLQHVKQMQPCPLCIIQRYAFIGVALI